jgi:hypothetical protein
MFNNRFNSVLKHPGYNDVGSVISAGASLIGGSMASRGAERAGSSQADAARYAADVQRETFERQVGLQDPFRRAGLAGQNELLRYLGITPQLESRGAIADRLSYETNTWGKKSGAERTALIDKELAKQRAAIKAAQASPEFGSLMRDFSMKDFTTDPGYAFRMSEGLKGLDRQAAARGGLISGAALRGAQRFGQDLASQEYTNAFNRYQTNRANKLNPLQSLTGAAQTSANTLGTAAQQYGQNVGELALQGANARASGYMGSANAWANALGQAANIYTQNRALGQTGGVSGGFGFGTAATPTYGFSSIPGTTGVNAFLQG